MVKNIAEEEGIPSHSWRRSCSNLPQGTVALQQGPDGGFALRRRPGEIRLLISSTLSTVWAPYQQCASV